MIGCFFIALFSLITPAGATPFPLHIGGRVTGLNETNHTVTILSECDYLTCDKTMPGAYEGTVTNDAVFFTLQPGDSVELMYKSWLGMYPCEMEDYKGTCTIPEHAPIPVGQWAGISRVVKEPGTGLWVTTDFFGDPGKNQLHLINNYSLDYEPGPDLKNCPVDQPVWECSAGYVNISLLHDNRSAPVTGILRNKTYIYEDPADKTTVSIQFFGGIATSHDIMSPGGGPYADMEVHVQPTPQRSPVLPTTLPTPLPLFVPTIAPGIAAALVSKRISKKGSGNLLSDRNGD